MATDHGDSGCWVDVSRDDGVQVADGELGVEGGVCGVLRIDGPDGSGDHYFAVRQAVRALIVKGKALAKEKCSNLASRWS